MAAATISTSAVAFRRRCRPSPEHHHHSILMPPNHRCAQICAAIIPLPPFPFLFPPPGTAGGGEYILQGGGNSHGIQPPRDQTGEAVHDLLCRQWGDGRQGRWGGPGVLVEAPAGEQDHRLPREGQLLGGVGVLFLFNLMRSHWPSSWLHFCFLGRMSSFRTSIVPPHLSQFGPPLPPQQGLLVASTMAAVVKAPVVGRGVSGSGAGGYGGGDGGGGSSGIGEGEGSGRR
jgi:hypothetical protein